MLTPEKIDEIRANTAEAIASEMYDNRPEITSLQWLISQFRYWKRLYLKNNQPRNYFRVTRIIPRGAEENRHRWVHKFQVWTRGKINMEFHIDADTYDHFERLWGKQEFSDMAYATYRSPAQLSAQQ